MFRPFTLSRVPFVGYRSQTRLLKNADGVHCSSIIVSTDRIVKSLGMMAALLVLSSIAIQLVDNATGYSSMLIHKMVKL